MNTNLITVLALLTIILSSCSGTRIATMRKSKMEQLELGMSKVQVVPIQSLKRRQMTKIP